MKNTTYYKFLSAGGQATHADHDEPFFWSLPTFNEDGSYTPGEWMPGVEWLDICGSGYHVTTEEHLLEWALECLYEAEVRGACIESDTKSSHQQARLLKPVETWNARSVRLFACDCVEHALDNLKRPLPDRDKVKEVVAVCRRYAQGKATDEELARARNLAAAAWDAARDAAWDAARDAARDAAWDAAWYAARDAAWDAARDAAWYAAWDAAWDAARDAARGAARYAAWDAARGAARYAAWDAEREWQSERLGQYLRGEVAEAGVEV